MVQAGDTFPTSVTCGNCSGQILLIMSVKFYDRVTVPGQPVTASSTELEWATPYDEALLLNWAQHHEGPFVGRRIPPPPLVH